jgi:putative transposase
LLTPATVRSGHSDKALAARQKTLTAAYAATPERFVQREPRPLRLPDAVWINPPAAPAKSSENPLPALH